MAMKQKTRPSFFTAVVEDDYASKIRIPHAFGNKYKYVLPENVKLRMISSGEIWDVKIEEVDEYKCFTMGWDKFVKDAELKTKEFLVFWFNIDNSVFDVSIFESRGLKRDISVKNVILIDDDDDDDEEDDDDAPETGLIKNNNQLIRLHDHVENENESWNGGAQNPRFKLLLKKNHCSRLQLPKAFAVGAGLTSQKATTLEYPPNKRRCAVILDHFPHLRYFRIEMCGGWSDFRRQNGLVYGETYSFEYIKDKNVIEVKCDQEYV